MRLPGGLTGISAAGFALARPLLERAIDDALDVGDVERLADVVERAGAHGLDRGLERAEPADQHDRTALFGLEPAQQVDPRVRRIQVDVRDQQIERVVADLRERRLGILHRHELPVRGFEQLLEERAGFRVVVDQEDARHG